MFHVEKRDDVAVVRMDDGKVNAMNPTFLAGFRRVLDDAHAAEAALVIAGTRKAFSGGFDLKFLPSADADERKAFLRDFVEVMSRFYLYPRPTVAFVEGPALAGGAILALACDLRLGTGEARLGLTEMPVGIPFPAPVLEFVRNELPRNEIGPAVFQGIVRKGADALPAGWLHRVVEQDGLEEAVLLARELGSFNPVAYTLAKQGLRAAVARSMVEFRGKPLDEYEAALEDERTFAAVMSYFQRLGKS